MAKESAKAKQKKIKILVNKFLEKRKKLKLNHDYIGLQRLPKNSSPVRLRNICSLTGRSRGYIRLYGISRIKFRELASQGFLPGVKKSSW